MTKLITTFSPFNLLDDKLKEIHLVLASYKLDTVILGLSKIAKIKYSSEKAKEAGIINDSNKHYLDRNFLPPFAIVYFIQQAMWIKCIENINKVKIKDEEIQQKKNVDDELITWLNDQLPLIGEPIINIDLLPPLRQAAAMARRIKNNQFPYYYSFMQGNVRLFRLIKILEIGLEKVTDDDFDFRQSFSKVFNNLNYDLFVLYIAVIYNMLTTNFNINAIKKELFLNADRLKFEKEYVDLIFEKMAICSPEEFFKLYEERKKTYIEPLTKSNESGEQLYYALHQYIPPIFRDKPICLVNRDEYICPSPDMLDVYFNESLFEIIRLEEKGSGRKNRFLTWFGKPFQIYCEGLISISHKNCTVLFERDLYDGLKNDNHPPVADINIMKDDELVLFDIKTLTPRVQALITGRESDNEMEWKSVYEKIKDPLIQIYNAIDVIKKTPENLSLKNGSLTGVKKFYPIFVTYFPIYDINTVYKANYVHEAIDYIKEKYKNEFETLVKSGIKKHRFLVINIYEFELLAELFSADPKCFFLCIREMLDEKTFIATEIKRTSEKRGAFTREPVEVIFDYMIKAKIKPENKEVWQHKQGDVLRDYFRAVYSKAKDNLLS